MWIYVVLALIHLSVLLIQIILHFTRDRPQAAAESNSSEVVAAAVVPVVYKYDVFLSYMVGDTGDNFTSYLYEALRGRRILTYIDDESLRRGEDISESRLKAIQESRMAVVVFSEKYANSEWCLDELVEILRCRKRHNQVVYPLFFRVNPDDVGEQKGSYAAAMKKHRKSSSALTRGKVETWREKAEAELVKIVAANVLRTLNQMSPIPQFTGLVGVECRVEKIKSLLRLDSSSLDLTRIIGVWEMGGMGKTTLARAIFDQLVTQFDSCHFLAEVRQKLEVTTELRLQQQLFSSILNDHTFTTLTTLSRNHLRQMKVLVVLDDVEDSTMLYNLLDKQPHTMFGRGSKIIVTSRDHQVLMNECDDIYKVEGLNEDESLQLFCSIAFAHTDDPPEEFILMSRKVVSYAAGNPMALVVFGKALKDRSKEYWESTLFRLQRIPNERIQRLLKKSFEGLDSDQKNGFLDIACLFNGESKEYVKLKLDGSYGYGSSEYIMASLVDKSLVRFSGDNGERVEMHDLVQEMGRGIVNEESDDDDDGGVQVGGRSRCFLSNNVSPLMIEDAN
ncbi:unnamed protein product [Linum tenue]|uniref:TIR domain-containing protein n=1 Tax=Linum tenue TaxID=586396 RepID=A0AAV0JIT4_9ROSI|nr:unnamed protein product [Linum tenue]